MTLTFEEMAYDTYVTVGRFEAEARIFEVGYWLGSLALYLDEGFAVEVERHARRSDWFDEDSFTSAREEAESSRREHTAEDLYLWAYDWMAGRTWPGI